MSRKNLNSIVRELSVAMDAYKKLNNPELAAKRLAAARKIESLSTAALIASQNSR